MPDIASAQAAPPLFAPRVIPSPRLPGRRLVAGLDLQAQALLLLLSAVPWLAAWLLWLAPVELPTATSLQLALDGRFGTQLGPRWSLLGGLTLMLAASSYVTVCAWLGVSQGLQGLRRAVREQAHSHAEVLARQALCLADVQAALRLDQAELSAAVGELARRTVALCGMLDADMHDAERAGADLLAIQDEERHALQLMSALRARLLNLAQHCQALAEAAAAAPPSRLDAAAAGVDELGQCASAEIVQCHQLSERVGGAERLNERRIESMRLNTDRLQCRAERALLEGQQLMALTRRIQATQAASLQRLEQLTPASAALQTANPTAPAP